MRGTKYVHEIASERFRPAYDAALSTKSVYKFESTCCESGAYPQREQKQLRNPRAGFDSQLTLEMSACAHPRLAR